MSKLNDLANFVADFHGVQRDPPEEFYRLTEWCAGDGATHDAPAVEQGDDGNLYPTMASEPRFNEMFDAYADWIIGTLYRPPGWSPLSNADAWAALSHPDGLPVDAHSDELRDWARTWTAANPSGG